MKLVTTVSIILQNHHGTINLKLITTSLIKLRALNIFKGFDSVNASVNANLCFFDVVQLYKFEVANHIR